MTANKQTMIGALMAEPMRLPGCPQIIVTRGWAYEWLIKLGYPELGGFGSVDFMVFGRNLDSRRKNLDPLTEDDLTDLDDPRVRRTIRLMEETLA